MKWIRYIGEIGRQNVGTAEEPVWENILNPMAMPWNEANEAIAKREAHKGEYEIVDDGQPDPADSVG